MAEFLAAWWWIDRWRKSTAYTDMTLAEQGAYRNLIDELWLRGGSLPGSDRILAKISGAGMEWPEVKDAVMARFYRDDDGNLRNETHDEVQAKSIDIRNSNVKAGRARAEKAKRGADGRFLPSALDQRPVQRAGGKDQRTIQSPSPSPSPNSGSVSSLRKKENMASPEAAAVATYLRDAILSHSPEHGCSRNGRAEKWVTDIDRAIRIDKRDPEALRHLIDYAHRSEAGSFWRANIQSGTKLRKHFDTLAIQARKAKPEGGVTDEEWAEIFGEDYKR